MAELLELVRERLCRPISISMPGESSARHSTRPTSLTLVQSWATVPHWQDG